MQPGLAAGRGGVSLLISTHSGALVASSCLRDGLGACCAYAAQAAFAEQPQAPEPCAAVQAFYARNSAVRAGHVDGVFEHLKHHLRHQWQQVAGLSAQEGRQVNEDHPRLVDASLRAALHPSRHLGFHATNLQDNVAILRAAGLCSSWDEVQSCSPELRGLLALAHPQLLQQALCSREVQPLLQLTPPGSARLQQLTPRLQQLLAGAAVRQHRPHQQHHHYHQQQQQTTGHAILAQLQRHQELQQLLEQVTHQKAKADPAQALAASLLQLLRLNSDHHLPLSALPPDLRAEIVLRNPSSSSSSSRSSRLGRSRSPIRRSSSPVRRSNSPASNSNSSGAASSSAAAAQADQRRLMSTSSAASAVAALALNTQQQQQHVLRSEDALATALARVERSVSFKGKAKLPLSDMQALLAQLQQQAALQPPEVLSLLLKRPAMLYQHCMQQLPGNMLGVLQQQLPDLDCRRLLAAAPVLLSCSAQQVAEVLQLLLVRLQLPQQAAAKLLAAHPRLLVQPAKASMVNLGFLVGCGLSTADLASMLQQQPTWLTRPLRELTQQWQYLQQVAKVSQYDVVLFPDLLSLPISSCIGPRLAYAAKHRLKLLMPSQAALLGQPPRSEWSRHRMVPLQFWLTANDQVMCRAMELRLPDYRSWKQCWMQVHASSSKTMKGA